MIDQDKVAEKVHELNRKGRSSSTYEQHMAEFPKSLFLTPLISSKEQLVSCHDLS
ncbi:MAG: hypothetical protein WBF33_21525 [Candidatus Nitrosopolaris sp.]